MSEPHHITIDLRADPTGPPSGLVCVDGEERTFVGWTGLLAALADVVGSALPAEHLGGQRHP